MLLTIKLYGGLTCGNRNLKADGLNRFRLSMAEGITLTEVYRLMDLNTSRSPVSIVNGHAQQADYILSEDCSISIFPPMADRKYNFFERL